LIRQGSKEDIKSKAKVFFDQNGAQNITLKRQKIQSNDL
jgi:hypothetical protein